MSLEYYIHHIYFRHMREIILNITLPVIIETPPSTTRLGCFYVTAILSWGYGWGWLEAEVDLNLRLKWDWDEIEWKFSWNWVEVELRLVEIE